MKIILAVVLAFSAATLALPGVGDRKLADKDFLMKQKNILQLFVRVHQPILHKEMSAIAHDYQVKEHINEYTNMKVVKDFLMVYENFIPRGEVFSVLYEKHTDMAVHLVNLFYAAKDYDTFFKTACWAREHLNEGLFVYAFSIAVTHREDCKGFYIPPIYDVYPHFFVDAKVIHDVHSARMQGVETTQNNPMMFEHHYNCTCNAYYCDEECQMHYFTHDVELNAYNMYYHYEHPFWVDPNYEWMNVDRFGELFLYTKFHVLARYNVERLCNDLPEVPPAFFEDEHTYFHDVGFYPSLTYMNGKQFPVRPAEMHVPYVGVMDDKPFHVSDFYMWTTRLREAIERGFLYTKENAKVPITDPKFLTLLGHAMESTKVSPNPRYYGDMMNSALLYMAEIMDPFHVHGVCPSAMAHYETMVRDPMYYRILTTMYEIVDKYYKVLPEYTHEELVFPGVKIENMEVDKLVTYFDDFYVDLDNAVHIARFDEGAKMDYRARTVQLNHKPFSYKIDVASEKDTNAMIRVFLAPKYNQMGEAFDLHDIEKYVVEIDRFPHKITVGRNRIERNSRDSNMVSHPKMNFRQLLKKIEDSISGQEQFFVDDYHRHCGFPEHLMLPKGKKGGMPFYFFVMVTPFEEYSQMSDNGLAYKVDSVFTCGHFPGQKYPDNKPMGFPFDRDIKVWEKFYKPNMHYQEVMIFHKTQGELNRA